MDLELADLDRPALQLLHPLLFSSWTSRVDRAPAKAEESVGYAASATATKSAFERD